MNLVDFVTLIPFYISILLEGLQDFEIIGKAGKILRLMKVKYRVWKCSKSLCNGMGNKVINTKSEVRFNVDTQVMRILRIYKLFRHFGGLQVS